MTIERISWPNKFPENDWLAGVHWANWLDGQTIIDKGFEVLTNTVTITEEAIDGEYTRARVSEGEPGIAEVMCSIETNQGNNYSVIAEFFVIAPPGA